MTTLKDRWLPTLVFWWLPALLFPPILIVSQSMCLLPYPAFLGIVADLLLIASRFSILSIFISPLFIIYFLITSLIFCHTDGEFVKRISKALACGCFLVLTILALRSTWSFRHQAFVRASRV
ncbi:hypothetical protein ACYOEI_16460 [Singulisphaera rosea]